MGIGVSILQTGTVRIRPSHRSQSSTRPVWLRRLRVLSDRRWTEPLPINAYLVDHPEGCLLFDAGESPRASRPGWFPWWQPFFHLAVDIEVAPGEGIGAQLAGRGIDPGRDLKAVVLSHLHHDHADGLPDLAGASVHVSGEHWAAFRRRLFATLEGAVPKRWPAGFRPHILEPSGPAVGPWPRSYPVTSDGMVVAVDTPGHVPGHLSLVVRGDQATYLLAGDATYDQALLDAETTDGVNTNPRLAIESLRRIKDFARREDIVVLPAHDPQAASRLAGLETFRPTGDPG
jgi:glyoxylase-like metal-dependent hydrolase (beta-lactamase superfamily II)